MKGPPITVKCDCGVVERVPYGHTWTCPSCGRRWNTSQIPRAEYDAILRQQRGFRFQAMAVAVAIAVLFIVLGFGVGTRFFLMVPISVGFWFILYMPQWRKKVRRSARSLPTWHLTPE